MIPIPEPKSTILFQLISGQLMPNYYAHREINPDFTVFLATAESVKSVKTLISVLGLKDENYQTEIISPFDWQEVYELVKEVVGSIKMQFPEFNLILNWTTGTKINSDATKLVFLENKLPYIYFDSEHEKTLSFQNNQLLSTSPYKSFITFKDLVTLQTNNRSLLLTEEISHPNLSELELFLFSQLNNNVFDWILHLGSLQKKVGKLFDLNKIIPKQTIENNNFSTTIEYQNGIFFLSISRKDKVVFQIKSVQDPQSALVKTLLGLWFEKYTFNLLNSCHLFKELILNTFVIENSIPINVSYKKNEFDVLGMTPEGYPVIFECKAGAIKPTDLDKFANHKSTYFGRYTTLVLVPLFALKPHIQSKANELGILVLDWRKLKSLGDQGKSKYLNEFVKKQNLK
ncbi:MAG: DUF1887 family protein [Bacteroidetes bacterium]|nr:DUF1887 family protein [Bacteroidota bacterium]